MRLSRGAVRRSLELSRSLFLSESVSLPAKRKMVDAIAGATRPPRGTGVATDTIAGVPVELLRPPLPSYGGTMLFLHGGGYAMGSVAGYRGVVARLALATGTDAVVAEYPLSPEHPYPTALDAVTDLYAALVATDRIDPARTLIVGDSAGGGLTLALALRLRDRGLPLPAGLGLICPWLDLTADIAGTRGPSQDPLITPELISAWAPPYVGNADPADPGISPALGDLSGLPPVVMHSAALDPLSADAHPLAARLEQTGQVEHTHYADLWHDFHLQVGFLDEARTAVADLGASLKAVLSSGVTPGRGH